MTTLVPTFTFGPAGFVAPSGPAVLAGVQGDINASFGNTLNYSLTTPQGQLAMSWAAIIDNTYATFQFYAQQMDPAYASGRMQDAIGRIYGMQRQPSIPTQLQVSCNGLAGVVIPFGALIVDGSNNLYQCATTGGGTIPAGGSIVLQFNAVVPGPTAVPATVSIYQAIPGWDTVGIVSGIIGQNVEGRSAFETRRQASVAGNSFGAIGSILGAVSSTTRRASSADKSSCAQPISKWVAMKFARARTSVGRSPIIWPNSIRRCSERITSASVVRTSQNCA